jgi:hypothetical protein
MLRFQILLVFPCMVAIVVYGLCLPLVFETATADESPAFCDPDLVSVPLTPGDTITWSIAIQSSSEPPRTINGEGVIEEDGRVFLGPPYWPVQVAGLTPIQVETIIHKDVGRRLGRSGLRRFIDEETYRVRVRLKRDIWIGSPEVLSTR